MDNSVRKTLAQHTVICISRRECESPVWTWTRHSDNIENLWVTVFYTGDPDVIISRLTRSILTVWMLLLFECSHRQTHLPMQQTLLPFTEDSLASCRRLTCPMQKTHLLQYPHHYLLYIFTPSVVPKRYWRELCRKVYRDSDQLPAIASHLVRVPPVLLIWRMWVRILLCGHEPNIWIK